MRPSRMSSRMRSASAAYAGPDAACRQPFTREARVRADIGFMMPRYQNWHLDNRQILQLDTRCESVTEYDPPHRPIACRPLRVRYRDRDDAPGGHRGVA